MWARYRRYAGKLRLARKLKWGWLGWRVGSGGCRNECGLWSLRCWGWGWYGCKSGLGVGGSKVLRWLRVAAEIMSDRLSIASARRSIALKTGVNISRSQLVAGSSVWHVVEICISEAGAGLLDCVGCNFFSKSVVVVAVIGSGVCVGGKIVDWW